MSTVFILLILFQVKHFLCDYPLQTPYMLGKFKSGWDFLNPLVFHCEIHSLFTLAIAYYFTRDIGFSCGMSIFDFVIHFFMDRIKAGPKYLGRFKDMYDKKFWWSLGLDQMVHHLTHYAIIYMILNTMDVK